MHYRGPNVRPTSIFVAPFVQLLMRPGHFIFTLWRAGARRDVRTTAYRVVVLPAVLPDPDRFVPAYANPMRKRRYGREKETAARGGNRARRDSFSIHLPARTIAGKIITVFTAERIHRRASEPAPCCKVDRQVSSTSASALDEAENSLTFYDSKTDSGSFCTIVAEHFIIISLSEALTGAVNNIVIIYQCYSKIYIAILFF